MKKIEAIIQPDALNKVKEELFEAKIFKMTVHKVRGCGQQQGYNESYRGKVYKVNLLEKIKIEVVVNDEYAQSCVDAIVAGARTGSIGDGKIFVTNLEQCIRIRTGEEGPEAVG